MLLPSEPQKEAVLFFSPSVLKMILFNIMKFSVDQDVVPFGNI